MFHGLKAVEQEMRRKNKCYAGKRILNIQSKTNFATSDNLHDCGIYLLRQLEALKARRVRDKFCDNWWLHENSSHLFGLLNATKNVSREFLGSITKYLRLFGMKTCGNILG